MTRLLFGIGFLATSLVSLACAVAVAYESDGSSAWGSRFGALLAIGVISAVIGGFVFPGEFLRNRGW